MSGKQLVEIHKGTIGTNTARNTQQLLVNAPVHSVAQKVADGSILPVVAKPLNENSDKQLSAAAEAQKNAETGDNIGKTKQWVEASFSSPKVQKATMNKAWL